MKKKDELEGLATEVAALPKNSAGHRRYPSALRPAVLAAQARYVASGGSTRDFAARLNIHSATLAFWAAGKQSGKKPGRVRSVRLSNAAAKTSPGSTAVVILGNGARIEGLTTRQLIEFARGCA